MAYAAFLFLSAAQAHTGAIALPIRHGERVLGCISVIWMGMGGAGQGGIRQCLEPLREAQELIERGLAVT